MRNVIGLAMSLIAVALVYAAYAHRNRVLAARAAAVARGETPTEPSLRSLAAFGEVIAPIILFFLGYLALKTTFIFVVFDGGDHLSYFDLAGFLSALAGYGYWIRMKTLYRLSDLAAPSSESAEPQAVPTTPSAATSAVAPPAVQPARAPVAEPRRAGRALASVE